ncbi:MAG: DUF58 domain-containing protein [Planctomycetota bacterium]
MTKRRATAAGDAPAGAPGASDGARLPSATVRFPSDFVARLGAFAVQLSAAREREEVGRRRTLQGEGQEFVGHRPYRPGEDLRRLDWDLLARVDRPFVLVHRSEAREEWAIAIDTSASMGVGRPGKLQSAAESAAGAVAVGLRLGARIALVALGPNGNVRRIDVHRPADLVRALDFLESLRSSGEVGLEAFLGGPERRPVPPFAPGGGASAAGRVLVFGDLLDVEVASVLRLVGGRRRIHIGQVLAPLEWDPERSDPGRGGEATDATSVGTLWVDAETGQRRRSGADGGRALDAYAGRLERFVGRWSSLAAGHAVTHRAWSSEEPFEAHLPDLLR